jgi:hypothetical protein
MLYFFREYKLGTFGLIPYLNFKEICWWMGWCNFRMIFKELFGMESIMGNFWKICQGYSFGAKINSRADNHIISH